MSNGIRDIETNARVTKLLCHPLVHAHYAAFAALVMKNKCMILRL